ncbi:odorant receptor 13a-like [Danaus plexippus]|uniref:odorant receptor 13a-like n=1 Tax=Danaus plexippus TaxID=13037 RepID=UPI002AB1B3FF|nr:odorant receptor 13a-like [Danaus plexippus]
MKILGRIWKYLTDTKALQSASGDYEILFFEYLYRITYLAGMSLVDRKLTYLIYSKTVKLLLILLVILEIWHFFTMSSSLDDIIEGVNVILIQIGTYVKYKTMNENKKVFKYLASAMNSTNLDIATDERKDIFYSWGKRNKQSLKLLIFLGTCTLVFWFFYPLFDDADYNLIIVISLPFDYRTPALYPVTYMSTFIVFMYIAYFVMLHDLVIQVYLVHLICQFAILNDCFENILIDCKKGFSKEQLDSIYFNEEFIQKYIKRLGRLVDQHTFIINNTLRLRDILSTPMLLQVAVSTTLICSIGFQIATTVSVNVSKMLMSLLYLGYNMLSFFIMCKRCEDLKIQSTKVGEAVYFSSWEEVVVTIPRVRTTVLLILLRAHKPIGLTGGGMYELSLEAYGNMIKTSYSALTVLLRLR